MLLLSSVAGDFELKLSGTGLSQKSCSYCPDQMFSGRSSILVFYSIFSLIIQGGIQNRVGAGLEEGYTWLLKFLVGGGHLENYKRLWVYPL